MREEEAEKEREDEIPTEIVAFSHHLRFGTGHK
jgi:hypothetical protein